VSEPRFTSRVIRATAPRVLTRDPQGALELGGVSLAAIPTPAYVYDVDAMVDEARRLREGFAGAPHLVAFAVKANTAGPIVRALAEAGCGAEVVSGGELAVALACGVPADAILYSGVGKTAAELDAALGAGERGILALQMESVEEIARVEARAAALGRRARVSLRLNPNVVADTHAHVATGHDEAKFGIVREDLGAARDALARAAHVDLVGIGCHIGSQLTRTTEFEAAAEVLLEVVRWRERDAGPLAFVDFGGGFGVDYGAGCPAAPADFARAAASRLAAAGLAGRTIVVEPGRCLVAAHGVLCASVVATKRASNGRWLVLDAGMNDLLRPALYAAFHRVEPIDRPAVAGPAAAWRVVGPVCESSDDFGEHPLGEPAPARVALRDAGAYGYTMASEYNGRGLLREVFVRGGRVVAVHEPRDPAAWAAERAAIGR
jgi:diaminopimelate decarboxylase